MGYSQSGMSIDKSLKCLRHVDNFFTNVNQIDAFDKVF